MDSVLKLLSGMGQGLVWVLISSASVAIILSTISFPHPHTALAPSLYPPLPPLSMSRRVNAHGPPDAARAR